MRYTSRINGTVSLRERSLAGVRLLRLSRRATDRRVPPEMTRLRHSAKGKDTLKAPKRRDTQLRTIQAWTELGLSPARSITVAATARFPVFLASADGAYLTGVELFVDGSAPQCCETDRASSSRPISGQIAKTVVSSGLASSSNSPTGRMSSSGIPEPVRLLTELIVNKLNREMANLAHALDVEPAKLLEEASGVRVRAKGDYSLCGIRLRTREL